MKKLLLLSMALCLTMGIQADDPQKVDASKVKKITFNGDQMTIEYADGSTSTTVDMETVIIDFSNTSGIEERVTIARQYGFEGKNVYRLNGQLVGKSMANLTSGVYIIDGKKILIK